MSSRTLGLNSDRRAGGAGRGRVAGVSNANPSNSDNKPREAFQRLNRTARSTRGISHALRLGRPQREDEGPTVWEKFKEVNLSLVCPDVSNIDTYMLEAEPYSLVDLPIDGIAGGIVLDEDVEARRILVAHLGADDENYEGDRLSPVGWVITTRKSIQGAPAVWGAWFDRVRGSLVDYVYNPATSPEKRFVLSSLVLEEDRGVPRAYKWGTEVDVEESHTSGVVKLHLKRWFADWMLCANNLNFRLQYELQQNIRDAKLRSLGLLQPPPKKALTLDTSWCPRSWLTSKVSTTDLNTGDILVHVLFERDQATSDPFVLVQLTTKKQYRPLHRVQGSADVFEEVHCNLGPIFSPIFFATLVESDANDFMVLKPGIDYEEDESGLIELSSQSSITAITLRRSAFNHVERLELLDERIRGNVGLGEAGINVLPQLSEPWGRDYALAEELDVLESLQSGGIEDMEVIDGSHQVPFRVITTAAPFPTQYDQTQSQKGKGRVRNQSSATRGSTSAAQTPSVPIYKARGSMSAAQRPSVPTKEAHDSTSTAQKPSVPTEDSAPSGQPQGLPSATHPVPLQLADRLIPPFNLQLKDENLDENLFLQRIVWEYTIKTGEVELNRDFVMLLQLVTQYQLHLVLAAGSSYAQN
ncbi:hypothetical protein HDU93_005936 [Gonapodya sp. JEL0774]|nr:hypothetical protein HDU93_005936 [Gonapodya sp. JEL0774]